MKDAKNFIVFSLTVLLSIIFLAFVRNDDKLLKIISSFNSWVSSNPQERIYLHTNNDYFEVGDRIWFKAYIVQGSKGELSNNSEALYVDLINHRNEIIQTVKLQIDSGLAQGEFELDSHNDPGDYKIRAYTRWMQNYPKDHFFEKSLAVYNQSTPGAYATINFIKEVIEGEPNEKAKITFRDENGEQISNRKTLVEVFVDDKLISTKILATNDLGDVQMELPAIKSPIGQDAYIKATVYRNDNDSGEAVVLPITTFANDLHFSFFPEGGKLINGESTKVAFKFTGEDGSGLLASGIILENNKEVVSFSSDYAGIGTFNFKPEIGKSYTAKLKFNGVEKTVELPKIDDISYSLSARQDGNIIEVQIKRPANKAKIEEVFFMAQSNGEIVHSAALNMQDRIISVRLEKNKIPAGVCQLVLVSEDGDVLNERIVFVTPGEANPFLLSTDKQVYNQNDDIELSLNINGQNQARFFCSVAVNRITEKDHFDTLSNYQNIYSNLLLTSALGQQVVNPGYYFLIEGNKREQILDDLMLTTTDKRYDWPGIVNQTKSHHQFALEKKLSSLGGQIIGPGNRPIQDAEISLLSLNGGILEWSRSGADGKFVFEDLLLFDGSKFIVQAKSKDETNLKILMDKPAALKNPASLNRVNTSYKAKHYLVKEASALNIVTDKGNNAGRRLKEVNIKARKINEDGFSAQGMIRIPDGHADQTLYSDKLGCISLHICLQGRFPGIVFISRGFTRNYPAYYDREIRSYRPMNVYLDGRKLEDDEISDLFDGNSIDPKDIGKVELVRTNLALLSMLGQPSILIITKKGYRMKSDYPLNSIQYVANGFHRSKTIDFLSKQVSSDKKNEETNLSKFYWNPFVDLNSSVSNTLKIGSFSIRGTYRVIVEGVDDSGRVGRAVTTFKVQ